MHKSGSNKLQFGKKNPIYILVYTSKSYPNQTMFLDSVLNALLKFYTPILYKSSIFLYILL
jgi:hypothetical protein